MGYQYITDRLEDEGLIDIIFNGPIKGFDSESKDIEVVGDHVAALQNVKMPLGSPIRVDGYSLLGTGVDTVDDQAPQGFGQRRASDGTDEYVVVQADGVVNKWLISGPTVTTLMLASVGIAASTDTEWFASVQTEDYLVFFNPTAGNWKYDGTNFLPLGAKIINNCQATTDWTVTGDAANIATSATAAFGTASLTFDALLLNEEGTMIYDPTTLDVDTGILLAKDYTEADRFCFWFRCDDVSTLDTTATLCRIETSSGNDFDFPLSAWTDEDGTVITPADNTWHRVELVISDGTEAGTYDHTSVDLVEWTWNTDGTGGCSVFLGQVYMQYASASVMPGCQVAAVWNNTLITAKDTTNLSDLHFAKAGGPDQYSSLAFIPVDAEDGHDITALHRFYNQVFIGKQNSIHSLGGSIAGTIYPNYNFEIVDITTEHGCDSHRAVVESENTLRFPWQDRFYEYNGTGTKLMPGFYRKTTSDFEETRLYQKQGAYHKTTDMIWWSFPGNGDTDNTHLIKYDSRNGGFIGPIEGSEGLDLNVLYVGYESDRETLIGIDGAGDIMNLVDSSATDFDGTAIVALVTLPWTSAGLPRQAKHWGDIYLNFLNQSSGSITLQYRVADHPRAFSGASYVSAGTFDQTTAENLGWLHIGEVSRWIQIRIRTSAVVFDMSWPVMWQASPLGEWS